MTEHTTYKALHLIFMVTWFAALFYMPRLFVYHAEAKEKSDEARKTLEAQYRIMQKRLWFGIAWPSMLLLLVFGVLTLKFNDWYFLTQSWMQIKLGFVGGLVLYHFGCHYMYKKFQSGTAQFTSMQMRLWNEVATVFLVAIIFLAASRDGINWMWGVAGLVIFSVTLIAAIRIYKLLREKKRPS